MSRKSKGIIYILGIIGCAATICLTSWFSIKNQAMSRIFYDYLTPNVLFMSMAIFLFVKDRAKKYEGKERITQAIKKIASYILGTYLVHIFVLKLLDVVGINALHFNPILVGIFLPIGIFLISIGISCVLNRFKFCRKYIV